MQNQNEVEELSRDLFHTYYHAPTIRYWDKASELTKIPFISMAKMLLREGYRKQPPASESKLTFKDAVESAKLDDEFLKDAKECKHEWSTETTGPGFQMCLNQGCNEQRFVKPTPDSGKEELDYKKVLDTLRCEYDKWSVNKIGLLPMLSEAIVRRFKSPQVLSVEEISLFIYSNITSRKGTWTLDCNPEELAQAIFDAQKGK